MKTDKELYKLFQTEPLFLFLLTNLEVQGGYDFKSVEVKAISRAMDGLLTPELPGQPHYVVEFQSQKEAKIYDRIILEMACLGLEHPENIYYGILIFKNPELDNKREPWTSFANLEGGKFQVFYLSELLDRFVDKQPEHPLAAVFYPYREKELVALEKNAATYYTQIKESDLSDQSKEECIEIFIEWLSDRFKYKTKEEIKAMLPEMCAFEETQCYQDILMEGKIEARKQDLENYQKLKDQGVLSEEVYQTLVSQAQERIKELEAGTTPHRRGEFVERAGG